MTTVLKINDEPFLSTPSARRATMEQIRRRINNGISIHALREEGDPQLRQGQLCRNPHRSFVRAVAVYAGCYQKSRKVRLLHQDALIVQNMGR